MRFSRFLLFAAMIQFGILGQARAGIFTYTGALQEYIVPTTGVYYISAAGAEGGLGQAGAAGLGAFLSGDFLLVAGSKLEIIVGGRGANNQEGGGGGGSFVYIIGAAQPIIAAGGGGGGGLYAGVSGGQTTTSGAAGVGPVGGAGGTGGSGGSGGNFSQGQNGGGGAGWLSNGTDGLSVASGGGGFGPSSFTGGAAGSIISGAGGFGGGGGAGSSSGGGGGGYSGGGGESSYGVGGGGGGSYLDPGFTNTTLTAATHTGNGVIEINSRDAGSAAVPEPTSITLLGTGALALLFARRKRRQTKLEMQKGVGDGLE